MCGMCTFWFEHHVALMDAPFQWLRLIRCARGAGSVSLTIIIASPSLILQSGLQFLTSYVLWIELKRITRLEARSLVQSNTSFDLFVN